MAEQFDAIVVGSGLGGLTAGALYARAGHRVLLLERNANFGGAATTYRQGEMTVEASLHETADPRRTIDPKGAVFEALDLYDDVEFAPASDIYEVRGPTLGAPFVLPHGFEAIEAALIAHFPHQKENIKPFLRQVRRTLKALDYIGGDHGALWRIAHAAELPLELWAVMRDARSSLSDVLQRYFGDDEAIKIALAANLHYFSDDPDEFWWLGYAVAQGGFLQGGGNYIKGGSQHLSDSLVEIIRNEGGDAKTECEVVGVAVNADGKATGVRYHHRRGGDEVLVEAPVVFANAAPHAVSEMLPQEARDDFMSPYRDRPLSISLFHVAFGLTRPPSEIGMGHYSTQLVPGWVEKLSDYKRSADVLATAPGERMPILAVVDYSQIDSRIRGDGLYPVSADCLDQVSNWEGLSPEAYDARKDAWRDAIMAQIDREWPGFADAVAQTQVATARTMQEYLNTPDGALYGFAMRTPREGPITPPLNVETSVEGLWLASSFAGSGGYTGAMGSGAAAAQAALKAETSR